MNNRFLKSFGTSDTTMTDSYIVNSDDKNVSKLIYHEAEFSGDRHYVDVVYKNDEINRIFNLDWVEIM